jgi:hypothetical protein
MKVSVEVRGVCLPEVFLMNHHTAWFRIRDKRIRRILGMRVVVILTPGYEYLSDPDQVNPRIEIQD